MHATRESLSFSPPKLKHMRTKYEFWELQKCEGESEYWWKELEWAKARMIYLGRANFSAAAYIFATLPRDYFCWLCNTSLNIKIKFRGKADFISGDQCDLFNLCRQKAKKHDGWVTEFVNCLKGELESAVGTGRDPSLPKTFGIIPNINNWYSEN